MVYQSSEKDIYNLKDFKSIVKETYSHNLESEIEIIYNDEDILETFEKEVEADVFLDWLFSNIHSDNYLKYEDFVENKGGY